MNKDPYNRDALIDQLFNESACRRLLESYTYAVYNAYRRPLTEAPLFSPMD